MLDNEEYPNQRPITPPPCRSTLPVTPDQCRSTSTSPPPHPSATRISNQPVSPDPQLPGGYNECIQRVQLLCEMDQVPRRLTCVPVPNPCYFNPDNVATGCWLSNAQLLATAYVSRDPASYAEAMRSENVDEWMKAYQYEIDALSKNNMWDLVDLQCWTCKVDKKTSLVYFHSKIIKNTTLNFPKSDSWPTLKLGFIP